MRDDLKDYRSLFVGIDEKIIVRNGIEMVPINFDNAATTPALRQVKTSVIKHLDFYGSIGRGKGIKSCECTEFYEDSRDTILKFFGINDRNKYMVLYVKNTTEGINTLANALVEKGEKVISTRMEHHANDLPWRDRAQVIYIDVDSNGNLLIDKLEEELMNDNIKVVSVTAASNVTGHLNSINKIAKIAHKYGAMFVVDAAQLVAHKSINLLGNSDDECIDFLVFSAHKMYAPFGSGVIIARKDLLEGKSAFIKGGGAVNLVFDKEVYWEKIPELYEAGTPNFIGVVALVEAIKVLSKIGFDKIDEHEMLLRSYIEKNIKDIKNIIQYGDLTNNDRLGIVTINAKDIYHEDLAKKLSDIRGIAVRQGSFCAHPYVNRLLGLSDKDLKKYIENPTLKRPGMVRISFGLYNNIYEIDEFLNCLEYILSKKIYL